jgi:DNA-binding GntR family transcriptional regulator
MPKVRIQSRSLEEAVYDAVRQNIIAGDLKPGDHLVEAQLSADFGISKTPVREALIRLSRDGLVEQAPYRVSRVATPTEQDIRQVCELRRWIEGKIAATCAEERDPRLLSDLEKTVLGAEAALESGDAHRWAEHVNEFSDVLVATWGNRYGADLLERLRNVLALIANISQGAPGRRERSVAEHRAIYEAIAAGDPERAEQATLTHLDSIQQDSLAALEALSRNGN